MQIENEFEYTLKGTERQTLWGYHNPEFDEGKNGVILDAFASPESVVPFRYSEGRTYWLNDKGSDRPCMNYVFRLVGDISRQEEQFKLIGAFTHALPHDWEKYHVAHRSLGDEVYSKGAVRTFIYRVYENDDERCFEHPEMLAGAPTGMYHCGVCMEMVMAGLPHPTKTQLREFHDSLLKDIREEPLPTGNEKVNELLADGLPQGAFGHVVIAPGEYSDTPVSLENVDPQSIVMLENQFSPVGAEQFESRIEKRRHEFRTREEQKGHKADD